MSSFFYLVGLGGGERGCFIPTVLDWSTVCGGRWMMTAFGIRLDVFSLCIIRLGEIMAEGYCDHYYHYDGTTIVIVS